MNLKNYLLKKLLKWANKKCKNFNIYNVVFFVKKIKKNNTWRYRYFTHVYRISSWYELQFLRYRVPHTEIGSYGSFFGLLHLPLLLKTKKKKKTEFWNEEIASGIIISHTFTHVYQKPQSHEVQFLRYRLRQNFLSFWTIFYSFTPLLTPKIKIWKQCKKTL